MGVKEQNRRTDGFLTAEGGVDSGFAATLLAANQLAWAVNTTVRDGFPKPRPGWAFRNLSFPDGPTQIAFEEGLFQGFGTYIADGPNASTGKGQPYLVVSISGRVYSIAITANNSPYPVTELTSPGNRNSATQPHAWFQQAENWLVVQNMLDIPLLWNGAAVSRSNANRIEPFQVPIGGPMAYGRARLAVSVGNSYVMGDLVGGDPVLNTQGRGRNSVIYFTENTFLNEGGSFPVPGGDITALIFGENLDTSLGDGSLFVFTSSAVFAFDAPIDRTIWKNLTYPIQRFASQSFGAFSHDSVVQMNSDVCSRGEDGIYSLRYARRDFADWGQTPISRQVWRALRYDSRHLLDYASAVNFDNRLLMTVQPQQTAGSSYPDGAVGTGVYHRGLVVMDYHLVAGMGAKLPPVWEGVWTGLKILAIDTIGKKTLKRCFIWALNDEQRICLWEVTRENAFDFDGGDDVQIRWVVESRSLTFGNPDGFKQIEGAEQWYDQVAGEISATLKYRCDLSECWHSFGGITDCARYRNCDETIPCACPR